MTAYETIFGSYFTFTQEQVLYNVDLRKDKKEYSDQVN